MARRSSREPGNDGGSTVLRSDNPGRFRAVKRERLGNGSAGAVPVPPSQSRESKEAARRVLRSKYLKVIDKINDSRDDISNVESDVFNKIITEVENLHQQVEKPREQVADAEALLDITNTLVTSVKSFSTEGITPADYVSCLVREFGISDTRPPSQDAALISFNWKDLGMEVSPTLRICHGMSTMLGPMNTEIKLRKQVAGRKRTARPTETDRPENVDETTQEEKTDTDKNMIVMFKMLNEKKQVKLESLVLNRRSFAQTVENLFALSFLVKDGRAQISMDESNSHFVSPTNAPDSRSVTSGEVAYRHFVFRFDFKDWKLMMKEVPEGEELMPHRESVCSSFHPVEPAASAPERALPSTPIRKLSRNRGLVLQEETVVAESPEAEADDCTTRVGIRRGKRKLIEGNI